MLVYSVDTGIIFKLNVCVANAYIAVVAVIIESPYVAVLASTVKEKFPLVVAYPIISPVDVDNDKPLGKELSGTNLYFKLLVTLVCVATTDNSLVIPSSIFLSLIHI